MGQSQNFSYWMIAVKHCQQLTLAELLLNASSALFSTDGIPTNPPRGVGWERVPLFYKRKTEALWCEGTRPDAHSGPRASAFTLQSVLRIAVPGHEDAFHTLTVHFAFLHVMTHEISRLYPGEVVPGCQA